MRRILFFCLIANLFFLVIFVNQVKAVAACMVGDGCWQIESCQQKIGDNFVEICPGSCTEKTNCAEIEKQIKTSCLNKCSGDSGGFYSEEYRSCAQQCYIEASETSPTETQNRNLIGGGSGLTTIGRAYGQNPKSLEESIGNIINIALTILGIVFFLLTIYGGYIWMIARGDESEAKRAKDIITMATIGLVVVLAAYAISYFIFSKLLTVSGLNV